MFGGELLMALAQGQRLRGLHETAGAVGVFLEIHVSLPRPMMAPVEQRVPDEAARLEPYMWERLSQFEEAGSA